jgi:hypothetical protein
MPWSWVRVSTGTSPKLRQCTAGDPSARKFEECARALVERAGGDVVDVKFEPNGRFARVYFYWEDFRVKSAVVYDLQGREGVDVVSADELDGLRLRDGTGA